MQNVLFICTGNSARSILAEALMTELGRARGLRGYSAGSQPKGQVHPLALQVLATHGIGTDGLRSKSWDEFAQPGAPVMDFIFTVCDQAAGEACPFWPGHPATAHWGMPDPAAVEGDEAHRLQAFNDTFIALQRRIGLMLALPLQELDHLALQHEIRAIGQQ